LYFSLFANVSVSRYRFLIKQCFTHTWPKLCCFFPPSKPVGSYFKFKSLRFSIRISPVSIRIPVVLIRIPPLQNHFLVVTWVVNLPMPPFCSAFPITVESHYSLAGQALCIMNTRWPYRHFLDLRNLGFSAATIQFCIS